MLGRSKRGSTGTPAFKSFKSPGRAKPASTKSPQQCAMDGLKKAAGMGKGKR